MSRRAVLAFAAMLILLSPAPARSGGPAPAPRYATIAGQQAPAAYVREARIFLEKLHLLEAARNSIDHALAGGQAGRAFPHAACMKSRFDLNDLEPVLEPTLLDHLNLAQLREFNRFLDTPLGIKTIQTFRDLAAREMEPPSSEEYAQAVQALKKKSCFKGFMGFIQAFRTWTSTPEGQVLLAQLHDACNEDALRAAFTPPPIPAHATPQEQEEAYVQESRTFLALIHMPDILQDGIIKATAGDSQVQPNPEWIACMKAQLTPDTCEPHFRPYIRQHLSYENLVVVNAFLQSPLGAKFVRMVVDVVVRHAPKQFTPEEASLLSALGRQPSIRAANAFMRRGMPDFSEKAMGTMVKAMESRCNAKPQ